MPLSSCAWSLQVCLAPGRWPYLCTSPNLIFSTVRTVLCDEQGTSSLARAEAEDLSPWRFLVERLGVPKGPQWVDISPSTSLYCDFLFVNLCVTYAAILMKITSIRAINSHYLLRNYYGPST